MTDPTDLDALRDAVVEAARSFRVASKRCPGGEDEATWGLRLQVWDALDALDAAQRPPPVVPSEPGAYYLADGRVCDVYHFRGEEWRASICGTKPTDYPQPPSAHTWATEDGELVPVPGLGEWEASRARDLWVDVVRERDEARAQLARVREVLEDEEDFLAPSTQRAFRKALGEAP